MEKKDVQVGEEENAVENYDLYLNNTIADESSVMLERDIEDKNLIVPKMLGKHPSQVPQQFIDYVWGLRNKCMAIGYTHFGAWMVYCLMLLLFEKQDYAGYVSSAPNAAYLG